MDALLKIWAVVGFISLLGCENTHTREELVEAAPYEPVLHTGPLPHELAATGPSMAYQDPGLAATPQQQVYEPPPAYDPSHQSYGNAYVIRRGDTLWSIAKRVYNDGKRWSDIQAANPGLHPQRLRVGQEIHLP